MHLENLVVDAFEPPRLLALGARRHAGGGPEGVLTDPEGKPLPRGRGAGDVRRHRAARGSHPRLRRPRAGRRLLGVADGQDRGHRVRPGGPVLRHRSGLGPVLELQPEQNPQGATRNRLHLDVRLEAGESQDAAAEGIAERGGDVLRVDWGELPWRPSTDPSGNEFCVLPVSSGA